jgi:hypothetical protein
MSAPCWAATIAVNRAFSASPRTKLCIAAVSQAKFVLNGLEQCGPPVDEGQEGSPKSKPQRTRVDIRMIWEHLFHAIAEHGTVDSDQMCFERSSIMAANGSYQLGSVGAQSLSK